MKSKNMKPDEIMKDYWRDNNRFADLFNQVLFNGTGYLHPEKLSDTDAEESAMIMSGEHALNKGHSSEKSTSDGDWITTISRRRDLIKRYSDGAELVLIGLENQMLPHYAMPVRSMLYDSLRYTRQCKELENRHRNERDWKGASEFLSGIAKEDRIKPVISIVLYYGETPWDGPIHLSDMMNIPPLFKGFYNDQRINLLQIKDVSGYEFQNRDNRDLFTILGEFYSNGGKIDIETFQKKYPDMGTNIYWETLAVIGAVTGSGQMIKYAKEYEGRVVKMWSALENWERSSIEKGIEQGRRDIIFKMYKNGIPINEIAKIVEIEDKQIQKIINS